jgi:glycosyltransferase involved in cell wall biosynthesis
MHILRIIARLNVGGPARHVVWLTESLQDSEFDTTLIAGTVPPGEEDMSFFADQHGVKPVLIEEMSRELSIKDAVSIFKIYREMRRRSPAIVHTHTAKAGTVGRVAALAYKWLTWSTLLGRPRKVSVVHTFHGHVFHSYYGRRKTRLFIRIERVLARVATDKIIVISPQQRDEIASFGVGSAEQFAVVPLGIELAPLAAHATGRGERRTEFGADEGDFVVGFVGRLTEIKNVSHLLKVAAAHKEQKKAGDASLKFVIIGDGGLRSELEREAEALGIWDLLTFIGNRTDAESYYAGLDALALTSKNEGTPLSLIEAMAAGVPVISTGVGGVVDLLGQEIDKHDGYTVCERGVRVDTVAAEDFLAGLLRLTADPQLRSKLTEAASEYVRTVYSKDRLVADIRALYRELSK